MSRLVAVSNRVAPARGPPQAGGLAVVLADALRTRRGLWFGWSGKTGTRMPPRIEETGNVTRATVDLSERDVEDFYNGFANRCLWPLFHLRPDLSQFERAQFDGYRRVNARFGAALAPLLEPDDVIWVHDFHLFCLATELRRQGAKQRIGFFLHIPFPPRELFVTLPCHQDLLNSLLNYDLVGFQTPADAEHFASCAAHLLGAEVAGDWIRTRGRRVRIGAFPVGIDGKRFRELAFSPAVERDYLRIRESLRDRDQVIGVDRLDYSKGLLRRMTAFELLLERHPDTHRRVEYLQVAPISRGEVKAYRDFRLELERRAARINGRYGDVDWTPVRYLTNSLARPRLAACYRASRIGLVTPMRDGMNLVAKEYVAAQDTDDPGVLVLSRFAGAAPQMQAALVVNPYDAEEVADAMQKARSMKLGERRERHAALLKGVLEEDAAHWYQSFLAALNAKAKDGNEPVGAGR